jgi:hypothetical protein
VTRLLVPNNAKVAVIKACLYDPQVNRTYAELAAHYGTAVLPARPYRSRDKAKVEACVGIVERWLLGRLRHRVRHGLGELNAAIADLMARLNHRVMRRLGRQAAPEDVDYRSTRGRDRRLFDTLLKGEWIDAHDNLAICGPTGIGKSWLAGAIGHKASRQPFRPLRPLLAPARGSRARPRRRPNRQPAQEPRSGRAAHSG